MSDLSGLELQAEKAYLVRLGLLSFPLLLHAENDHPDFITKIVYPCFWSLHASWASCISLCARDALSNLYKLKLPSIRKELDARNRNGPDPFDAWSNTHRGLDNLTKFAVEPFFSGSQTNSHFAEKYLSDAMNRRIGFSASIGSRSSADPVQIREHLLSPIWSDKTPQPIVEDWRKLRSQLVTRGDLGWLVDWYDDRVGGNAIDDDLELTKALIPLETWDNGPAAVNAQIARLIREHEGDHAGDGDSPEDLDAREVDTAISIYPETAIDQTEQSALSDFLVDEDTNETRTTPMPDDPPPPEDPYRMRDQSDRLSVLKDLAKNLHTAFLRDKPQVPTSLRLDLNNYAREAAEQPENVRPRMLIVLGNRFAIALEDDDIRAGMSNYLVSSLEGLIQEHAGLVAAYYRVVAEQAQQRAAEVEAQPVERLQELEAATLESAEQIEQLGEHGAPKPATGFLADLRAEMASLREQQERLPLISDEAARQAGARQISVSFTQWSATQVRHVARIVEHAAMSKPAIVTSLFGTIWTVIEKILPLLF